MFVFGRTARVAESIPNEEAQEPIAMSVRAILRRTLLVFIVSGSPFLDSAMTMRGHRRSQSVVSKLAAAVLKAEATAQCDGTVTVGAVGLAGVTFTAVRETDSQPRAFVADT